VEDGGEELVEREAELVFEAGGGRAVAVVAEMGEEAEVDGERQVAGQQEETELAEARLEDEVDVSLRTL